MRIRTEKAEAVAWSSAFWNCNAVLLYNYCMGTDEMGNVRTGIDRVISSVPEYICSEIVKNTVKGNISIEKTKMEKDTWGIADVGKLLCPYDTCYHVYGVLFPKADVCSQ